MEICADIKPIVTWFVPEGWKAKIWRIFGRLAWHPNHSAASVWIRGYQVARYLEQLGYYVLCNQLKPIPHIAIFLRRYSDEDVALAQHLKRQGAKIVVDIVVNYFVVRESGNKDGLGAVGKEMVDSFRKLVNTADQVWCVSPFLRDIASSYHHDAHFVADSVDPQHFNPVIWKKDRNNGELIFGWSGYSIKAGALSILKPWITSKQFKLLVISDKPPNLDFSYEFRQWRYEAFPKDISECDLCVAPREVQDDYDRGHSFFKIGVFMAMGVPALAGPVPSYRLLLDDKKGGAICQTKEDWEYYIERFLIDPALRFEWCLNAPRIMEPYLTTKIAEQVNSLMKRLL